MCWFFSPARNPIYDRGMTVLLTLIASHINSPRRLSLLHKAIASAVRETDQVWVSLSWDGDDDITLPQDDHLTVFKRVFARCSQMTHWMMLGHALVAAQTREPDDFRVGLLDDDDAFHPGARTTFDAAYMADQMVMCGSDVSGALMHASIFIDTLGALATTLDPTDPMADTTFLKNSIMIPANVVSKTPFDPAESTWFNVYIQYDPRVLNSC